MAYPRYPKQKSTIKRRPLVLIACVLVAVFAVYILFSGETDAPGDAPAALSFAEVNNYSNEKEYPKGELPAGMNFDRLVLEKSKHTLTAYSNGVAVRVYYVALGREPRGHKQFQGDMKTPEGKYTINDKNPNSAYRKNLGLSYPNKADREFARQQGKNPGGDIKIHGLAQHFAHMGAAHRQTDWTYGSIAVTNPEIDELFARTPVGTPIEILP